jgi:hypothetical protein
LLQRADDSRDQRDIPYRNANTALHAAWQATEDLAVAALNAGDTEAAHALFVQASADALRVDETLQKLRTLAPDDATIVSFWSTLASMVQQSAAGEAQALVATDRAAADAAFARAAAYFERPQEQDFASPYRRKAWAAVVAGTEVALDDEPRAGEPISDAIWACLENGHAVVADTSVTSDDYDRQQASDVLNGCLDTVATQIDARRQEVNRLWNAGELEDAAGLLRLVIVDEARINGLREYSGPWNDLYLAIAQRDLATIENQAGDETAAAAARQAAMTLFQPYLPDIDYIDDTATHVALAKAALADVQAAEAAARARAAGQAGLGTTP